MKVIGLRHKKCLTLREARCGMMSPIPRKLHFLVSDFHRATFLRYLGKVVD